jgi:transcription antitermination factor NusG
MKTLTNNENPELKWFVFYTSPRAEKVVYKELVSKEYEVFLPLKKELKIWKNRQRKFIDEPLFPSYIFVKARACDIYNILKTRGIHVCIMFEGIPCTIPDKDIEAIRIMIELEKEISSNNDFKDGEEVCVIQGPLTGYEGVLFKQKGSCKFGIRIKGVDLIASIDISIEDIQRINNFH